MGLNKNDRAQIVKIARNDDYSWNSDKSKMTDGKNEIRFSESGGSVFVNGQSYNTVPEVRKKLNKS